MCMFYSSFKQDHTEYHEQSSREQIQSVPKREDTFLGTVSIVSCEKIVRKSASKDGVNHAIISMLLTKC